MVGDNDCHVSTQLAPPNPSLQRAHGDEKTWDGMMRITGCGSPICSALLDELEDVK